MVSVPLHDCLQESVLKVKSGRKGLNQLKVETVLGIVRPVTHMISIYLHLEKSTGEPQVASGQRTNVT